MMFYLVIAFLVISSFQTEAVKVILRQPNNDAGNNTRIIGGVPIGIEEAPWQAAIYYENEIICGGSILNKDLILTAAHCVVGSKTNKFLVKVGSAHLNKPGQLRRVSKIWIDGSYNRQTNNNDIAIMKLRTNLQINQRVTPVKLASSYYSPSNSASVTGWGVTRESAENPSPVLRKVTVQFVTLKKCQEDYRRRNVVITPNMVCAGATNGGRDACQGDSGGPLVENGVQYGIVSVGIGCGRAAFPGVYTSIVRKLKWIQAVSALN